FQLGFIPVMLGRAATSIGSLKLEKFDDQTDTGKTFPAQSDQQSSAVLAHRYFYNLSENSKVCPRKTGFEHR
ncbi:MAG: hypothetical protein WCS94_04930, partial [Verrucomicrobiota bacterium]